MVGFGEKLDHESLLEWRQQYVDYVQLKRKLEDIITAKAAGMEQLLLARRHIFQGILDQELEKASSLSALYTPAQEVLAFYQQKVAGVKRKVDATIKDLHYSLESDLLTAEQRIHILNAGLQELQALADEITNLLNYVSLNMAAVRKILKKFGKHVEPAAPTPGFLALEISHPHDPDFKMLQGTYLPAKVGSELGDMAKHTELTEAAHAIKEEYGKLHTWRRDAIAQLSAGDRAFLQSDVAEEFERHLASMEAAEAVSRRNADLVHTLAWSDRQAGIFTPPPPDDQAIASLLGLFLCCASSTLYMANYQVVIPSLGKLCSHLGVSPSYAGVIVGATDIAAIPITIVYSLWSNKSFKQPLLFASAASVLANICFCISYDWGGMAMLTAARFITGLGSSRSVSRRYIADFVPKQQRMAASAAFVCSSALGMAAGPLLSLPLSKFPHLKWRELSFTPITMGGYIMASLWLLYALVCFLFFDEPLNSRKTSDPAPDSLRTPLLEASAPQDDAVARMEAALPESKARQEAEEKQRAQGTAAEASAWRASLLPTAMSILVLFMLKMVQQGYMDSLPLFTGEFFGWDAGDIGVLLTVLGLSALPVSASVGYVSRWVSDRNIVLASVAASSLGCLALALRTHDALYYFGGGTLIFMGTLIMEGAGMSLLSKVIHPRLAHGLLNAGLLATEAGTLGRFTGNIALSIVGSITGAEEPSHLPRFGRVLFLLFMAVQLATQTAVFSIWPKFKV